MERNKTIHEYNLIRVIAVLLVVIGHCTYYKIITEYGGFDLGLDVASMNFISKLVYRVLVLINHILYTFHMPLFFCLSGALFNYSLKNKKYKTLKELVCKKGKRLLIPFVIVSLLYTIPIKYLCGYYNGSQNIIKDIFVGQILQQGNTHLWFLPTLFCIFVIVYIYIYIQRSKLQRFKILNKYMILGLLIIMNVCSSAIGITIIKNIFSYLLYFCVGYYFEFKREEINEKIDNWHKRNYTCLIILILILSIIFKIFNRNINIYFKLIGNLINIILALAEIVLVYIFSYKLSKAQKIIHSNIMTKIGEYSFGIYLYSDPINYVLLSLMKNNFSQYINTTFGIIGLFLVRLLVTLLISIVITFILKKYKAKYVC